MAKSIDALIRSSDELPHKSFVRRLYRRQKRQAGRTKSVYVHHHALGV